MTQKPVYFLSDLHLGATYQSDSRAKEQRVVRFLDSIRDNASELYLLGDILDYWYEYKTVVPRGYVRFFGALARLADAGVKITWFIGNHDIWLFDYLRDEIGIRIVDGIEVTEIMGHAFLLTHGDGVGKLKPSFRFIRSMFRNRICQKLYSAIHPRWTIPFALRWSSHSRGSETNPTPWQGAKETIWQFAHSTALANPDIEYFIFGHRHLLIDEPLTPTSRLIILGDWLTHYSYAVFDGKSLSLHKC